MLENIVGASGEKFCFVGAEVGCINLEFGLIFTEVFFNSLSAV